MKKALLSIISIILVVLLAFTTPFTCMAVGTEDYIKDIKIGYGESGKQALKDAGYTVWESLDANEGGNGDSVWIGYLPTSNASDAIRDLAVMNMNGGYSFEDFKNELKTVSDNVTEMLTVLKTAIVEFRNNYNNDNEFAKLALFALNKYIDDDTNTTIGTLFLDENTPDSELHKVFMQGNVDNLDVIVQFIALGLTETTGDTVLDRLANVKYTTSLEPSTNMYRQNVLNAAQSFKAVLTEAENSYKKYEECGKDFDSYMKERKGSTEEDEIHLLALYEMATKTAYGDTNMSLFEAMMLPLTSNDANVKTFDASMADVLVRAMTEGQNSIIGSVGLEVILNLAYGIKVDSNGENGGMEKVKEYLNIYYDDIEDMEEISVFAGVDRSLFSNAEEDIALTSAAIREKGMTADNDFGVDTSADWRTNTKLRSSMIAMASIGAAATIATAGCLCAVKYTNYTVKDGILIYTLNVYSKDTGEVFDTLTTVSLREVEEMCIRYDEASNKIKGFGKYYTTLDTRNSVMYERNCFGKFSTNALKMFDAFFAIAAIVTVIFTVMALITNLYKPKESEIEYSKIPRVLVDVRNDINGNKTYFPYYATKLITAKDGDTDTLSLYGDLNGHNKKNPWLTLYYSKDERLGEPLTTDMLIQKGSLELSYDEIECYKGIHSFKTSTAVDLNEFNTNENAKPIYVLLKKSADSTGIKTSVGSLFNLENYLITGISVVVGAAISFAITYMVMKKKKKEQA